MAKKEYRELSCRETGANCGFLVRAETTDEAISVASEHACRVHNLCQITPDERNRMSSLIKTVWCGGEFVDIQELDPAMSRGEWLEN